MDMANDLMAILNPEAARKLPVERYEGEAGVQSGDNDRDAGNLRFGGTEESQSIPPAVQWTPPKSFHFLGQKIMEFMKSVPGRVGRSVAGCFGKPREMNGDGDCLKEEREAGLNVPEGGAAEWSPDMDPAVVGFYDLSSEPHFDYSRLERQSEEAWYEFEEWWASFLEPLAVITVDDSDFLDLLLLEEMGDGTVSEASRADSSNSGAQLSREDSRDGWEASLEELFWGTLPAVQKGRVAREVERLENAMKAKQMERAFTNHAYRK